MGKYSLAEESTSLRVGFESLKSHTTSSSLSLFVLVVNNAITHIPASAAKPTAFCHASLKTMESYPSGIISLNKIFLSKLFGSGTLSQQEKSS